MPKLKICLIAVLCFLGLTPFSFAQTNTEEIVISTYYPSPYGVYNEMRAMKMAMILTMALIIAGRQLLV